MLLSSSPRSAILQTGFRSFRLEALSCTLLRRLQSHKRAFAHSDSARRDGCCASARGYNPTNGLRLIPILDILASLHTLFAVAIPQTGLGSFRRCARIITLRAAECQGLRFYLFRLNKMMPIPRGSTCKAQERDTTQYRLYYVCGKCQPHVVVKGCSG